MVVSLRDLKLPTITKRRQLTSPAITPQALAWDGKQLWMSSRDLGTLHKIDVEKWKVVDEIDPPGIVWAAVAANGAMQFTVGRGVECERAVERYHEDPV